MTIFCIAAVHQMYKQHKSHYGNDADDWMFVLLTGGMAITFWVNYYYI